MSGNSKVTNQVLREVGRNTLESIKESYNYVASRSKHVLISNDSLNRLIAMIDVEGNIKNWLQSSKVVNLSKLTFDQAVEFLIFFHNINFSYWGDPKWSIDTLEHGTLDGSQAMLYVCQKILKDNDFNPENLSRLTYMQFVNYFSSNGYCKIPMIRERYNNTIYLYSDICDMLRERDLTCSNDLLRELDLNDEVILGFIMHHFKHFFEDSSIYNGQKILFYKRAQLLTSDLLYLLGKTRRVKSKPFNLLGCADYKIPQVLNLLNVLQYDDVLSRCITSKKPMYKDHSFEVEIRANTLKVIELISEKTGLSRMEVNDRIWLLSQEMKDLPPYHLVRTTAY